MFFLFLFIAHIQAVFIPVFLGIKSFRKLKNIKNNFLILLGFICFGMASMSEMLDHTNTNWVYVNHTSLLNWFFYSFLTIGITLLSISLVKNKFIFRLNIFLCFCSIFSYLLFGKQPALLFQVILSASLIINWQIIFKDWLITIYPIFGIVLTTFFGINLSTSGNQIWHLFIGPSGTISVATFYFILKRGHNKLLDKK